MRRPTILSAAIITVAVNCAGVYLPGWKGYLLIGVGTLANIGWFVRAKMQEQ